MKKTVSLIIALLLICTTLFSLTACGGQAQDTDKVVAEATAPLKAQIEALEKEISSAEAKIADLEAENATLKSEKASLADENATLKAKVAELESENEELEALVAALRNCLKGIHTYSGGICIYCEAEQGGYVRCDKDGTENAEGEYLLFGEYPQTIKADDVTITETQDTRGYYLGSDGSYYAMVTASPCQSAYTFSTGSTVASGSVYYFKVEPIRWRILSEENGEALILCDSIIANVAYQPNYTYDNSTGLYYTTANGAPEGTYANNYKYSNVRNWLNSTFYETAFSSLESSLILTTEVDNSAKSTNPYGNEACWNSGVNDYACENTSDKIFLLSEEEATNTNYGFASYSTSDTARMMLTSDYSRATGAYMSTSSSYYGNGWWWLRSPCCYYSDFARAILCGGNASAYDSVSHTRVGVAPALRITL